MVIIDLSDEYRYPVAVRPNYYGLVCHGVSRQLLPTKEMKKYWPLYTFLGRILRKLRIRMSSSYEIQFL